MFTLFKELAETNQLYMLFIYKISVVLIMREEAASEGSYMNNKDNGLRQANCLNKTNNKHYLKILCI